MNEVASSLLSAATMLFLLIDPLGNIPAMLAILKDTDPKRQRMIIARELLIALAILILFLYAGKPVLSFLQDRKSTRLNSSHVRISYAVFCLKKKKTRSTTPS